jgi:hypothetical protein
MRVCLASLGGALCPAPIRWVDPCGSGRFVIQHFNVADQVADVFYTIEIRIRDFHGGEGLLYSAYLFKRQQDGAVVRSTNVLLVLPMAGNRIYFALPAPAFGQPAIQALTASAVPRFCIPPPAATLLRLHLSIQAGSF